MNATPKWLNTENLTRQAPLLAHDWPPVQAFAEIDPEIKRFLDMSARDQDIYLSSLRAKPDRHGMFIQRALSFIYAYWFGYSDSPVFERADDSLERKILGAKLQLEREMLDHWLQPVPPPEGLTQQEAVEYLSRYIADNSGVFHKFFDYIRSDMPSAQLLEFLKFESVRNEVVDDEVALIVIGLQGQLKNSMASNLWDECGNGEVTDCHTYWLRRLLDRLGVSESFPAYRAGNLPWFTGITSNSFNMMATRPGYKYRAYGSFLVTESWVNPHFERILAGLERNGIDHEDISVYFSKHWSLDPHHTNQMLTAINHQQPILTPHQVREILWGAHTAVAAGTLLYDFSLKYFTEGQAK